MDKRTCSIEGCGRPHAGRGYCHPHHERWRLTGDPRASEPIARRSPDVNRHRPRSSKYTLNEAYFDEITTQEQAYWLGFVAADGGIIYRPGKYYSLRVELAERDAGHLEALAASLGSSKPITHSVRRNAWSPTGEGRFASAVFDSWRLVEALDRLGIKLRKSATAEPWNGPADLMPHYWRGLFDGDGAIGPIAGRMHWNLQFCGSEACVRGFAGWAHSVCGTKAKPRLSTNSILCWNWSTSGSRMPQALARALYQDAVIALPRKRLLADELCAIDLKAAWADANRRRSIAMRTAWPHGTYLRARRQ